MSPGPPESLPARVIRREQERRRTARRAAAAARERLRQEQDAAYAAVPAPVVVRIQHPASAGVCCCNPCQAAITGMFLGDNGHINTVCLVPFRLPACTRAPMHPCHCLHPGTFSACVLLSNTCAWGRGEGLLRLFSWLRLGACCPSFRACALTMMVVECRPCKRTRRRRRVRPRRRRPRRRLPPPRMPLRPRRPSACCRRSARARTRAPASRCGAPTVLVNRPVLLARARAARGPLRTSGSCGVALCFYLC
jgi:hypothetical protein